MEPGKFEGQEVKASPLPPGTRGRRCLVVYVMDILTRDSGTQFRYNLITKTSPSCLIDSIHLTDSAVSRHMPEIYKRQSGGSYSIIFIGTIRRCCAFQNSICLLAARKSGGVSSTSSRPQTR